MCLAHFIHFYHCPAQKPAMLLRLLWHDVHCPFHLRSVLLSLVSRLADGLDCRLTRGYLWSLQVFLVRCEDLSSGNGGELRIGAEARMILDFCG